MEWKKEGNMLFNDTLSTFYIRLYDVGYMLENHSDSEFVGCLFHWLSPGQGMNLILLTVGQGKNWVLLTVGQGTNWVPLTVDRGIRQTLGPTNRQTWGKARNMPHLTVNHGARQELGPLNRGPWGKERTGSP